mmetsp:Transcript_74840/g.124808  ORF Transcript_74840/g.124808 Transcript_74840/m.124808 type:complete len:93 (+) Transcript_74840:82-360(+)
MPAMMAADEPTVCYALHVHFGSEELVSLGRIELVAAKPMWSLLDWCCHAPAYFTARQAWEASGDVSFAIVAKVLHALSFNGFCSHEQSLNDD